MPEWEDIFREKGRVFTQPHPDMDRIADVFQNHDVVRVLDIGCGTGRHLVYLASRGFQMFGFDASQQAINLAQDWLNEANLSADIKKHRMENRFPYENMMFDAIISVQVIHHNRIRDIRATIMEIERVLRVRGYIFITVSVLTDKPVEPKDSWQLKEVESGTYLPQRGPESGVLHHYFSENELLDAFSAFQIDELYIDDSGHRCIFGTKI